MLSFLRDTRARCDLRSLWRTEVRRPLNWLLVLLLAAVAAILVFKPGPATVGGKSVSLYPPQNLFHIAYVVFFLRLVAWWRESGRQWAAGLDVRVQEVVRWHLWPAAAWLLLPRHPGHFLWYLSLANADPTRSIDVLAGLRTYARWLMEDYHRDLGTTVLAGVLCAAGLLAWRRLRPGGAAVLWLVLLAGGLTVLHPNQKGRNLHSWVAAAWVAGGVGLAALLYGRFTAGCPRATLAGGGSAGGPGLDAGAGPGRCRPCPRRRAPARTRQPPGPHGRLPAGRRGQYPHSRPRAVPVRALTQWAVLERCGRLDRLEEHWWGFADDRPGNRAAFTAWLGTTACDTLVFVDRLPGRPRWEDGPECVLHADLLELLRRQDVFRLVKERDFPDHCCRVLVCALRRPLTPALSARSREQKVLCEQRYRPGKRTIHVGTDSCPPAFVPFRGSHHVRHGKSLCLRCACSGRGRPRRTRVGHEEQPRRARLFLRVGVFKVGRLQEAPGFRRVRERPALCADGLIHRAICESTPF